MYNRSRSFHAQVYSTALGLGQSQPASSLWTYLKYGLIGYAGYYVGKTVTQAKTFNKGINLASHLSKVVGKKPITKELGLGEKKKKSGKKECHHIFHHANTPEERKRAVEALEYARSVGDSTGVMVALAALQSCE